MFNDDKGEKAGRAVPTLLEQAAQIRNLSIRGLCNYALVKRKSTDEPSLMNSSNR